MSGVRFELFEFDQRSRSLRKRGVRLRVPDQSLTILEMLLQRPGEIVTREEIRDHLWPHGTIVEYEHSVNSAVQRLREALSDSASAPRYIETLAKRGYRFIAAVESAAASLAIPNYRILDEIGRGAMGVVYRATDTRLGREVAVKVLRPDLDSGTRRKVDLIQEARAASTLNHPNIVTVHDVGTNNGLEFIVMEYIDGKPLRDLIGTRGMGVPEALGYAVQIADALAKAHAAGIVHLDLKPGNIMVTAGGLVKILDFGIARFTAIQSGEEEGMIAGTAGYMSPEQVQGLPVDARSDVFSLGCLLYEMLSGQRAFSSLYEIVHADPKPLPSAPPELGRILGLCLRKDRAERFQDIVDLRLELEKLRTGSLTAIAGVPSGRKRWRTSAWILAAVAATSLLLAAILVWRWREEAAPGLNPVALTSYPGLEAQPTFSPDGGRVAFTWDGDKGDNLNIYVKQVGSSGTPLRLTTDPSVDSHPAWSRDDRWIAFNRARPDHKNEIRLVPPLAGLERPVTEAKDILDLCWSQDGKWIIFSGRDSDEQPPSIFAVPAEGGERRRLTQSRGQSRLIMRLGDTSQSISPDGRSLAFAREVADYHFDLYVLRLTQDLKPSGEPVRITNQDYSSLVGTAWMADGREIVYSAGVLGAETLWRVPVSGWSRPKRLDFARPAARFPAISAKARRLAYTWLIARINTWRYDTRTRERRALIDSTYATEMPQYSPDGRKIAFQTNRSGDWEVWTCDTEGANCVQLTAFGGPQCGAPTWSPDSKMLALDSRGEGNSEIYVMDADGGRPRNITNSPANDLLPSWSGDGRWIYFTSDRSGHDEIWRIPRDGGQALRVTYSGGERAFESPDGKYVYFAKKTNGPLFRVPTGGGEPVEVTPGPVWYANFFVTARGLYFSRLDTKAIYLIPTGTTDLLTIANLDRQTADLTVSSDERYVAWSQWDRRIEDLILVENFR